MEQAGGVQEYVVRIETFNVISDRVSRLSTQRRVAQAHTKQGGGESWSIYFGNLRYNANHAFMERFLLLADWIMMFLVASLAILPGWGDGLTFPYMSCDRRRTCFQVHDELVKIVCAPT